MPPSFNAYRIVSQSCWKREAPMPVLKLADEHSPCCRRSAAWLNG